MIDASHSRIDACVAAMLPVIRKRFPNLSFITDTSHWENGRDAPYAFVVFWIAAEPAGNDGLSHGNDQAKVDACVAELTPIIIEHFPELPNVSSGSRWQAHAGGFDYVDFDIQARQAHPQRSV